jgi:hypothetical protein
MTTLALMAEVVSSSLTLVNGAMICSPSDERELLELGGSAVVGTEMLFGTLVRIGVLLSVFTFDSSTGELLVPARDDDSDSDDLTFSFMTRNMVKKREAWFVYLCKHWVWFCALSTLCRS